jgi:hypothetical protein
VIRTVGGWEHKPVESYFYVSEFRRMLAPDEQRRDTLVQFWGKQYRRQCDPDTHRYPSTYEEVLKYENLHTVAIKDVIAVLNLTDDQPYDEDDVEMDDDDEHYQLPEDVVLGAHIGLWRLKGSAT